MTEEDAVWQYLHRSGLYMKHRDLRPHQIMALHGLEAIRIRGEWKIFKRKRKASDV